MIGRPSLYVAAASQPTDSHIAHLHTPAVSAPILGLGNDCASETETREHSLALVGGAFVVGLAAQRARMQRTMCRSQVAVAPNVDVVEGLEPKVLWKRFAELSSIPRPSHHEGAVREWIKNLAEARSLKWQEDDAGNLVVRRPGSGGGEDAPPVCIQGHIDMVTEKAVSSQHDFLQDPIRLMRDGGWLTAQGTTLGSDNGIGVCAALALLESEPTQKLPPLECLFTVAEEVGLVGAFNLNAGLVSARTMLNLDTEEWPKVYFGCAGGGQSNISLPVEREPAPMGSDALLRIAVGGLKGGHSGLDIGENHANALLCCARIVQLALAGGGTEARLVTMMGGDKQNAIPREATAYIALPSSEVDSAQEAAAEEVLTLREEFGHLEEGMFLSVQPVDGLPAGVCTTPLTEESGLRLVQLMDLLPNGPQKMSHTVAGLVETSSNVASVKCGEDTVKVICSSRSSIDGALEAVRRRIDALCSLVEASCEQPDAYPGWTPDPSSKLLGIVKEELAGMGIAKSADDVEVHAIHAGLECGVLKSKCEGLDVVSFGPTITGAHSPDERVELASVPPFWELTLRVLGRLADRRD